MTLRRDDLNEALPAVADNKNSLQMTTANNAALPALRILPDELIEAIFEHYFIYIELRRMAAISKDFHLMINQSCLLFLNNIKRLNNDSIPDSTNTIEMRTRYKKWVESNGLSVMVRKVIQEEKEDKLMTKLLKEMPVYMEIMHLRYHLQKPSKQFFLWNYIETLTGCRRQFKNSFRRGVCCIT